LKITLHTVALQTSIFVELAEELTFNIQPSINKLLRIVDARCNFLRSNLQPVRISEEGNLILNKIYRYQ